VSLHPAAAHSPACLLSKQFASNSPTSDPYRFRGWPRGLQAVASGMVLRQTLSWLLSESAN